MASFAKSLSEVLTLLRRPLREVNVLPIRYPDFNSIHVAEI